MKSSRQNPFLLTGMAAALLLAFRPALAQDDEFTQLTEPQSNVDLGVGYVDKNNQRFGQYTGATKEGAYGIVDFNILRRNDSTGTWFSLRGRNLGYEDRELHFGQNRQGDWGYSIDYSRIPRYDPFTINTGLQGLGSTTQTVVPITPGAGADYHLKTTRDRWTLGLQKAFARSWNFKVRYRNEKKDGAQIFSQGYFSALPRFLTLPIDQTTQQIDAMADYTTKRFQMRAGYYGTLYDNNNKTLQALPPDGTHYFQFTGLPPGNQSHQFYVSGGYNFTDAMRGTFKVSYARATQDDGWPTAPEPGVTQGNLDARVDTTLLQGGLSGRLTPKFTWYADLRYENRDDKTPTTVLFPGSTLDHYQPRSYKKTTGKVIGHYALPMGFRLTGNLGYEQTKREVPEEAVVNFRERVDETTYGLELRRAVSQSVTGAVSYLHSKRDGSDWLDSITEGDNLIAPLNLADRDRDTVRLTVNWIATENLSLNFRADESRDDYNGRDILGLGLGPRKGRASDYSIDAAYAFTYRITGTAWYSHNRNRFEEATCNEYPTPNQCTLTGSQARPVFAADTRNIADSFGLGLRAKLSSKIDLGADLTQSKVRDEFDLSTIVDTTPSTPVGPLDNINTKVTTLRLYGKYALDRHSGVRLDYIYDQYKTDDWTWSRWIYADGTTVLQDPNQKVNFVGVSYYYTFH